MLTGRSVRQCRRHQRFHSLAWICRRTPPGNRGFQHAWTMWTRGLARPFPAQTTSLCTVPPWNIHTFCFNNPTWSWIVKPGNYANSTVWLRHCLLHQLKALGFLYAFAESVDCALLSSFCDDSNLRISIFKHVPSTMGVSKESISKFLICPHQLKTHRSKRRIFSFLQPMVLTGAFVC